MGKFVCNDKKLSLFDNIMAFANHIAARRLESGLSQVELAGRAGISRAAVSAIETGTVVPSVRVALALAREFDCAVEELFGDGGGEGTAFRWAVEPRAGCPGFWEVPEGSGTVRYPVEAPWMNPFPPDVCLTRGVETRCAPAVPTLVLACCDPAARFFAAEYGRASGVRMLVLQRNGREALRLLKEGAIHLGGIHVATDQDPEANRRLVHETLGKGWGLLRVVDWTSGIVLPGDSGRRTVSSAVRSARQWALREKGAAARECLDGLLCDRKPRGRVVRGHREVADAVRAGWADAGITLELCAFEAGLGFLPLRTEGFDVVFSERMLGDPRMKALVKMLQSRARRRSEGMITGYSTTNSGALVWS
jgi:molybdate-binding protein/DNA-binding XRE family transcriptional regulator